MDDYRKHNRAWWNGVVPFHVSSGFYKTGAFKRGENVLDPIVRDRLGNIRGKRVLHLQCHFGLDTLSLSRMGAEVIGLDFSPDAISVARVLSCESGVPGQFIEGDVLDPPPDLNGFDIVFASWGVINWIDDLSRWMSRAAEALKPRGHLLLFDGHPALYTLDDQAATVSRLTVRFPYDSSDPIIENNQGSYADPKAILESPHTVNFVHGLSRIFTAAIEAGFVIRKFEEFDRIPWNGLPQLVKADDFYWSLPAGAPFFPLGFGLEAELRN